MSLPDSFLSFSIVDLINVLSSLLTLILAYRIYRNFDVKKTHINKQLETVLLLVEEINKTNLSVNFKTKIPVEILEKIPTIDKNDLQKVTWSGWYYSLFIIGGLSNKNEKYGNVYINNDVMRVLPFLNYINHPLLPKEIAKKLQAFYSPFTNYSSFENASNSFVTIGSTTETNGTIFYQFPDFCDAFKNWDEFIRCAKELKKEIQKWLTRHGATDINFNHTLQYPTK